MNGAAAEIRFSCVPRADGGFSISFPQLFGIKSGVFFFWAYSDEHAVRKATS